MNKIKELKFKSEPYLIKNDKFSTIEFKLFFQTKYKKDYIFYLPLLRQILLNTSKNYPTEIEYRNAYKENMIISMTMNPIILNENLFFQFSLIIPDSKKIKGYNVEKAFKFFVDMIYNPNILNGEFDHKQFERERIFLKDDIFNSMKNVNVKAQQAFLNVVDDKGIIKENIYNNMHLIEEANPKELYDIYKNVILENSPIIIVYGNVDESINEIIKKYIKIGKKIIKFNKNYYNFLVPFPKIKNIEEKSKYNQSILYVAYKIKNANVHDKLYLNIIKNILSSGTNDLIFNKLRVEQNLIYSSNTWCDPKVGLLVVEAYINNSSKEKTIKSIKSVINNLKNKENLNKYLNNLIDDLYYNLIRKQDSRNVKIDDFINKKFEFGYKTNELLEKYRNIKVEELIDFLDRLKLDTIYFLRGEFDENN